MLYTEKNEKFEKPNRCNTRKQRKRLFKVNITTKLYVAQNIWQYFVAIRKSKLVLKLNKPAYIGMCILELTKVLIYEFHYDYIKNKYWQQIKAIIHRH